MKSAVYSVALFIISEYNNWIVLLISTTNIYIVDQDAELLYISLRRNWVALILHIRGNAIKM